MHEVFIELKNGTDLIVFSTNDLRHMKKEAGANPVTPLIVEEIIHKAKQKGYVIEDDKALLYNIAKQILLDPKGTYAITGHQIPKSQEIVTAEKNQYPLGLYQYQDPLEELDFLGSNIIELGYIPIIWSKTRGLVLKHLSKQFPLFNDHQIGHLDDPEELIRFIIQKPQGKVAYILEDFHHYIGTSDNVNDRVGNIRALFKELFRSLQNRTDRVFLFIPKDYVLPREIAPIFNPILSPKGESSHYLTQYGQLLTDPDYLAKTKPIIGVDHIIMRIIQVLSQMETNNPLLVGYPGVGKTAIVEGLAKAIHQGRVSRHLKDKMLYSLSLNRLIAGTRYRGDFEVRLEGLMQEVVQNKKNLIIFIDEIHTLIDMGATEGASGASDILKPLLARGEFPCIGATTFEGAQNFAKDPALFRRFKKIIIKPPNETETYQILKGILPAFEKHHGLKIENDTLTAVIALSQEHIKDQHLPGKAIALLDSAAAYCHVNGKKVVTPKDILMEVNQQFNFA